MSTKHTVKRLMRAVLVYQAGIANVFAVDSFKTPDNCRLVMVNWQEIADMMNEAVAS